jgi:very-short-patch-repair endonuclease
MNKNHTGLAGNLRVKQTDAEKLLWSRLRTNQLDGVKFRRQEPIGDYIVYFVSFDRNIIIELDGGQHNEESHITADEQRTKWLESRGFRVLRFWDNDVMTNIDGVLIQIAENIS